MSYTVRVGEELTILGIHRYGSDGKVTVHVGVR